MTAAAVCPRTPSGSAGSLGEQFVALYKEDDVLNEVLGEAHRDLKDPKGLAFA
jgi:hypothetical protein